MSVHVVCPACQAVNRVPEERLAGEWQAARCPKCATALFPDAPVDVTGAALRRHVERSDVPILVDCWAEWCGPCRMMAPAFAEAAARLAPAVRFLKLDTDAEGETSAALGIRSIPTLILFRGGREVARQAGALTAGQIARFVAANAPAGG
jgi:thioredoxin 2